MKFNPFCMCCAVGKQEQNIRPFQDMDKKVEYMKKVMDRMANIAEEDCAPSVSVELKKMFRDFWEQPMEDYTSVKKKYNQLMLDMEAFSYYDEKEKEFRVEKGAYIISVCRSAHEVWMETEVEL